MNREERALLEKEIYYGKRDEGFRCIIVNILSRCRLNQRHIEFMTTSENIKLFEQAFTNETADEKNNYEYFEILGDGIGNSLIVKYILKRFPHLKNSQSIWAIAELKKKFQGKSTLFKFADEMGFWDYISSNQYLRKSKRETLLEDVMEACFGVISIIIDEQIYPCVEYGPIFHLLSSFLDKIDVPSLKYIDLVDANTRLKELVDSFQKTGELTKIEYRETKNVKMDGISEVVVIATGTRFKPQQPIGKGSASIKKKAEQIASIEAIAFLRKFGIISRKELL